MSTLPSSRALPSQIPTESKESDISIPIAQTPRSRPLPQSSPSASRSHGGAASEARPTIEAAARDNSPSTALDVTYNGAKTLHGPESIYSDFPSVLASSSTTDRNAPDRVTSGRSTVGLSTSHDAARENTEIRAAKRRRVDSLQASDQTRPLHVRRTNANVPTPTSESNELVAAVPRSHDVPPRPTEAAKGKEIARKKRTRYTEETPANLTAGPVRGPSSKTKKARKSAKPGPSGGEPGEVESRTTPKESKRRNAKGRSKKTIEDAAAEVVEDVVQGASKDPQKRKARSRRAITPDGADEQIILPSRTTMSDLCTDPRIGRKSNREKQIDEFEKAELLRKKQRQLQEIMDQAGPNSGSPGPADSRLEQLISRREQVAQNVPGIILVNGQIRIDEDSLHIDRHKAAEAERDAEQLETVEETELTRKINSASFMKREKGGGWNKLLTDRFYQGLRMFGTDFGMISKMFPGRTRHKIKLKFVKEEKENYDKIKAVLLGEQMLVDLSELERMAGTAFEDPEELEKDLEEDRKRLEEEILAEKEAMDAAKREREAEIAIERTAAGEIEEQSAKENQRGKQKTRKGEERNGKDGPSRKGDRFDQKYLAR